MELELGRIGVFLNSVWHESAALVIGGAISVIVVIYFYAVGDPITAQTTALIAAVLFYRALRRAWLMNKIRKLQLLADSSQSKSGQPEAL